DEDDTRPARRRAQALSLDRALLRELLGQEELRELIDSAALAEVEASLRPFPQDPERLYGLLRLRGDLRSGEFDEAHAAILEAERRAIRVPIAREERLAAAEDAGRYRDALGIVPSSGLRREVQPVVQAALGRFASSWHGIDRRVSLRAARIPLQSLALPVALWEAEVLPRRVPDYRAGRLDQLCASGELVWVGAGLDRVAVFFRDDAPLLGRPAGATAPEDEAHDAIRAALAGGALFSDGLLSATELDA